MGDVRLLDAAGRVLLKLEGLRLRRVPRDWLARLVSGPLPNWCYELAWVPQPLEASPAGQNPAEPGHWLIFDSQEGLGSALAERLATQGEVCRRLAADGDPESRRRAVREFVEGGEPGRRGIVYLAGADVNGAAESPDFEAARRDGWGGALDIVQAVSGGAGKAGDGQPKSAAGSVHAAPPRLWLVTRGAQAVGENPMAVSLAQSPLWGLGRVIAAEHPELSCTRIDLDPQDRAAAAEQLIAEIRSGQAEDQVAYRAGERRVARLRHLSHGEAGALECPAASPTGGNHFPRSARPRGPAADGPPGTRSRPGGNPGPGHGSEFPRRVERAEPLSRRSRPLGRRVRGRGRGRRRRAWSVSSRATRSWRLAPASFASYALTLGQFVAHKPEHLSFEEAATIPICFLTTYYSLCRLGNMRRGERVLIHAASGGVGLSAIQIAKRLWGGDLRHRRQSPQTRLSQGPGHRAGLRFPVARFQGPDP